MSLEDSIRYALTLPPRVVLKESLSLARREIPMALQRWRDRTVSSYSRHDEVLRGTLYRYFKALPPEILTPCAEQTLALAELYLEHRFDLLGSGWVRVEHGMRCNGLEELKFPPGPPVEADREGRWLEGLINAPNLVESKGLWGLIALGASRTEQRGRHASSALSPAYVPIDWKLDFKSGYRWSESTWYRDVPFSHEPGVDIKVPWELGRMQHLPQLAWAWALASHGVKGERPPEAFALEFRSQILDFMASNPPRFGVNWRCTMDVGIRAANWLVAWDLFAAHGAVFDDAFRRAFMRSINEHGLFIESNLEWYSTLRSNHYVSNIAGLLFIAAYLPRTPRTDAWLAFSVQELTHEVGCQFNEDGSDFEASTSYHRLAAEMVAYCTALVLALPPEKAAALKRYDHRILKTYPGLRPSPLPLFPLGAGPKQCPFPPWYIERLEKMAEFVMHTAKPDGIAPQIGDNDSGRFLKLHPVFRKMTVKEARELYASLVGYHELPDDCIHWDESQLDQRHLVGAINGLFRRDDFTSFARDGMILDERLTRQIAGDTKLPSYLPQSGRTAAEDRHIGAALNWEALREELSSRQEEERIVTVVEVAGGGLEEGIRTYGYKDFGLYIFRSNRLYLAVRCGPIGQNGNGGHAHNDQLSIELAIDGKDLILDSGTYLYTPLPERRNQFRATGAHFTPQVTGREQGSWTPGRFGLFHLGNEARAECLYFSPSSFVGMHHGLGKPVWRMVEVLAERIEITDMGSGITLSPMEGPYSNGYGRLLNRHPAREVFSRVRIYTSYDNQGGHGAQ